MENKSPNINKEATVSPSNYFPDNYSVKYIYRSGVICYLLLCKVMTRFFFSCQTSKCNNASRDDDPHHLLEEFIPMPNHSQ